MDNQEQEKLKKFIDSLTPEEMIILNQILDMIESCQTIRRASQEQVREE